MDSQNIVECDNSMVKLVTCVENNKAYFLRVNITNQGLNDSYYERFIQFNMGKYITLQKAFTQDEIHNGDILKDISYFQSADMYYQGSIIYNFFHFNILFLKNKKILLMR